MDCGINVNRSEIIYLPELEKNLFICHHCDHHLRVKPDFYKDLLFDNGTAEKYFERLGSVDFLKFETNKSYVDQLRQAKEKTGDADAIKIYSGKLNGKSSSPWYNEFSFYWRKYGVCYW